MTRSKHDHIGDEVPPVSDIERNPPEDIAKFPPSKIGEALPTAAELVEAYGTNPDGSPRTEPAPDGPKCPPVSPQSYPFDTTSIPPGCGEPLSQECADYYNKMYGPAE